MDLLIFLVNIFLKESKSMTVRTIINIFYNNEQKITKKLGVKNKFGVLKNDNLKSNS